MVRIAVIDDVDADAHDISRLAEKASVSVYEGVPVEADKIIERAREAEVVICSWTKMSREVLTQLPRLRLLSVWATGVDNVDLAAASELGVTVCHVPSYATGAVAELTLGLMLSVMRKIPAADRDVRLTGSINWQAFQGTEISGKKLGIVGTGMIGQRVARVGHSLGMSLLGHDLQPSDALVCDLGMTYVPLRRVFAESDIISLHLPLTRDTERMVDATLLDLMQKTSIIINTARAHLLQQDDLFDSLYKRRIAGAGLDDVDLECESGRRLLKLENVVFTPHIGFNTTEAARKKTAICVENVLGFLEGTPINVVDYRPSPACGR